MPNAHQHAILSHNPAFYLHKASDYQTGSGLTIFNQSSSLTTEGPYPGAMRWTFDGVDDYAEASINFNPTQPHTLGCWVNINDDITTSTLIALEVGTIQFYFKRTDTQVIKAWVQIATGTASVLHPFDMVGDAGWHWFVYTNDGNHAKYYIDGKLASDKTNAPAASADNTLSICGNSTGYGRRTMEMSEPLVLSSALSPEFIEQTYNLTLQNLYKATYPGQNIGQCFGF